eukprot:jgi/Chlat1/8121/Chrsp75S07572
MVAVALDVVAEPLQAVQALFLQVVVVETLSTSTLLPLTSNLQSLDAPNAAPRNAPEDWGIRAFFQRALQSNPGLAARIPEINAVPLDLLRHNTLVRYRGMVQDIFNPQFYVAAYKNPGASSWQPAMFTDTGAANMSPEAETQLRERRLLYCVPVPAETAWCQEEAAQTASASCVTRGDSSASAASARGKRARDEVDDASAMDADEQSQAVAEEPKRQCYGDELELGVNEVAEFVGVLTFDPDSSSPSTQVDVDVLSAEEEIAHNPPASKELMQRIPELRTRLLVELTKSLGGDSLAAEYLLLHLVSRVYARADPVPLGKFSLNLYGASSDAALAISHAVTGLAPRVHRIPLTLGLLNSATLMPRKDYTTDRLLATQVQLADGTHLILDESVMMPGTLQAVGVANLQLLKDLIESQKVEYDFQYYKLTMHPDIPVLVLSEGKSMFPVDAMLPLRSSSGGANSEADIPLERTDMTDWRLYLQLVRHSEHQLDNDITQHIEQDIVEARQKDSSIGVDTFHRWLVMGRLLAQSFGEATLTLERWRNVRSLEQARMERMSAQR